MSERIYIYKRYERFWHWSQALLIIGMMITGFEVHGSYALIGFQKAEATIRGTIDPLFFRQIFAKLLLELRQ